MKYQVMPDLTPVEFEALKADIAQNGVLVPVEVDEDGNTLDGHHRIRAWQELKTEGRQLPDYPFILRPGLTEEQKRNHARRLNVQRRHLNAEQKAEIARAMVADREDLSTREAITEAAELTGLSQRRVEQVTSDIRQEEKEQRNQRIQELADLGWSLRDIADEVGVTHQTVSNVTGVKKSKSFDFFTPLPGIVLDDDDAEEWGLNCKIQDAWDMCYKCANYKLIRAYSEYEHICIARAECGIIEQWAEFHNFPPCYNEDQNALEDYEENTSFVPGIMGVGKSDQRKAAKVAEHASGTVSLDQAKATAKDARIQQRKEEIAKAAADAKNTPLPDSVRIEMGDFRELAKSIPDASVDLILTDPPYPEEFLPLWEDMARMARRVLKPGGYLVAYSGQRFLPQIYVMLGNHLDYQWTAAVQHKAGFHRIHMHDLLNAWKPVLIYSNGKPSSKMRGLHDLIAGGKGDKDAHHWAQPEAEASVFIDAMSEPGSTILDPFMGSGTVVTAAMKSNRKSIGFEIDADFFNAAKVAVHGS